MYPHRIRLRGPWQCVSDGKVPFRTTVPCDLTVAGSANLPVLLTRKFGYPGKPDPHECIWLTLSTLEGSARLRLNGALLGETHNEPFEANVTASSPAQCAGNPGASGSGWGSRTGDPRRRIPSKRESRSLSRQAVGYRDRGGRLGGTLELYILVDRKHAFYQTVRAGETFAAHLEEDGKAIKVELVNVSTVWYVVELPAPAQDAAGK